jgi:aminoglycoside phosphotransferase
LPGPAGSAAIRAILVRSFPIREVSSLVRSSPLELLLPEGSTTGALVLGDRCPPLLAPTADGTQAVSGTVDLVILAPSRSQRRDARWTQDAAAAAASRLSRTGIAYVVPGDARRLRRALADVGLPGAGKLLHVPEVTNPRHLVQVGTPAERWALAGGIAMNRWKRVLASGLGARGRAATGPTGAIHRRDPGQPLATWLFGLGGSGLAPGSTIVSLTHRGTGGAILYRFAGERRAPDAVAKLTTAAGDELRALREIAPAAAGAGVRVPRVLASGRIGSMPFVLESVVSGRRAADLVAVGHLGPQEVQGRLADWLETWSRSRARVRPIGPDDVARFLLAPASRAGVKRPYLEFLQELGSQANGRACSFVHSHGDLTLANVMIEDHSPLGIVDWEHASAGSLPLTDFLYASVDAVAARRRYEDRPGAFVSCFTPGGNHTSSLERLRTRSATLLELDEVVQTVCFHACWLQHAANEADRSPGSPGGPFVTILHTIGAAPELFGVPLPVQ